MAEPQAYGTRAMAAWTEKQPLTRGQALVVGLWLLQGRALTWRRLLTFVWTRGEAGTKEWGRDL